VAVMIPSARPAPTESCRLSETRKAAIFGVMLLTLALAAALLIRALDPPQMLAYIIWGSTPLDAVLIMMFLITNAGRTRKGRAILGLHRLGVRLWWIAILGTFLIQPACHRDDLGHPLRLLRHAGQPRRHGLELRSTRSSRFSRSLSLRRSPGAGTCCHGCCSWVAIKR
jgi:hypothetical protein